MKREVRLADKLRQKDLKEQEVKIEKKSKKIEITKKNMRIIILNQNKSKEDRKETKHVEV